MEFKTQFTELGYEVWTFAYNQARHKGFDRTRLSRRWTSIYGDPCLPVSDVRLLCEVLTDFQTDNPVLDNERHMMLGALQDFVATAQAQEPSVPEPQTEAQVQEHLRQVAAQVEDEAWRKKRDAIFHKIFGTEPFPEEPVSSPPFQPTTLFVTSETPSVYITVNAGIAYGDPPITLNAGIGKGSENIVLIGGTRQAGGQITLGG